jgi:uncharacterized protein (DUF934 family)
MPKLIKNRQVVNNDWIIIESLDDLEKNLDKHLFLPLNIWSALPESLSNKLEKGELGIFLNSDQNTDELPDNFKLASAITINFPIFTDGRGYSIARELRSLNYQGEIRAVGEVLHDQLNAMQRCGFDAYELVDDKDEDNALKAFDDFTQKYQADFVDKRPIYQR